MMTLQRAKEIASSFRGRLVGVDGVDNDDFDAIDLLIQQLETPPIVVAPPVVRTRHALVVGTNYRGTQFQLGGCVADAEHWRQRLIDKGHVSSLLDHAASRTAMLQGLAALVRIPNADLVFCFSGHGTQVPDLSSDESDRRDEAICPNNYREAGVITDDEIDAVLAGLAPGSKLLVIMDCCNSGSNTRDAYARRSIQWNPSIPRLSTVGRSPHSGDRSGITTLAACRDNETAADTGHSGAFTDALLGTIHEGGTLAEWCERAARRLREGGFQQHPVASGAAGQVKEFFA